MSALQPAVALHVLTALVQSPHLDGLQVQRSKGDASTGGTDASCGVVVVDDVEADVVDVRGVDVVPTGVLVDRVPPPGVVAPVVVVVLVRKDVDPPFDDDGLPVTVEAAELVAPGEPTLAGSPPSAAQDVTPRRSPSAPHHAVPVRIMASPFP
jgi:hypothetical protein